MSKIPVSLLALALLAACATREPPAPAAEDEALAPTLSLRRAVRETLEAVAVAREGGSTLRACEVQAHYHVGAIVRTEEGETPATSLRLGVVQQDHSAGTIIVTMLDDRCLARPRTPPAR